MANSKVLIVDDSDTVRSDLKAVLVQGGYDVLEAADGAVGLEVANQNADLNLIIADVNMPKLSGIAMCMKIRENPELKNVIILMLTTERSNEMKEQAKAFGVAAWIVKPFNAEKTLAGISKLIEKQLLDKQKTAA